MEQMTTHRETQNTKMESHAAQRIVGIIFGIIEALLIFRLIFKLLGANPQSGFVQGIYSATQYFVGIFEGIFSKATSGGAETTAVFEPATLIAIVVIALIAWAVLKLMTPRIGTRVKRSEYTDNDNQGR